MEAGIFEWIGCILGTIGSHLLAEKSKHTKWAWPLYLGSNFCLVAFGLLTKHYGIVVMQISFIYTSLRGIRNWTLSPAPQSSS